MNEEKHFFRDVSDVYEDFSLSRSHIKDQINETHLLLEEVITHSQIQEKPFSSHIPLIGPIIVCFRNLWNQVATKWYVLPLVQQQNAFNRKTVVYLQAMERIQQEFDERLIALDRDQVQLQKSITEVTHQLIQMNNLLSTIQQQLSRKEL